MNGVSIIICCYNSADRLPETLSYIAKQQVPEHILWEVIIIDNASSDSTSITASDVWNKLGLKHVGFYIFKENNPGLFNARIKGASSSNYEYIIFCDDDNWLNEKYIYEAYKLMSGHESIGAIGGISQSFSNNKLPVWFEKYKGAYAVGKQAVTSGDITDRGYIWGAGMVTRKDLFRKAFAIYPSILTDRKGNNLSSGGDSEYCCRLILMKYRLVYDESLKFIHYLPDIRLSETYKRNLLAALNESHKTIVLYHLMIAIQQLSFFKRIFKLNKSVLKYFLLKLRLFKKTTALYEKQVIYFITGFESLTVSKEAQTVYRFTTSLKSIADK